MRIFLSIIIAIGVALAVGGLCSFIFGLALKDPIAVQTNLPGLGRLNGNWWPGQYCFLGALLASIGSGCIAIGMLNWRRKENG